MRAFIKRYRVLLLLVILECVISIFAPEIGMQSFLQIRKNLIELLGILPPVFILLGLLDVWVDRQTMIKYTGPGSGVKGALLSFILGSAAAGPLYAGFPVAVIMRKKGSSIFNVFLFLGAWSTTKIPMLTFEGANLGVPFTAVRLVLSIIGITVIAVIMDKTISESDMPPITE